MNELSSNTATPTRIPEFDVNHFVDGYYTKETKNSPFRQFIFGIILTVFCLFIIALLSLVNMK